jgi:Spy/CpxP family protein refolding chaperone
MIAWWRARQHEGECGARAECGPPGHGHGHRRGHRHGPDESGHFAGHDPGDDGGGFGVRRPLRFLAWKLELEEPQVAELAKILADLKTERAQAAVDQRRTISALADLMSSESFDSSKADEAAKARVESAERLRGAVVRALSRIHAVLDGAQRERLAYLLRTGALVI